MLTQLKIKKQTTFNIVIIKGSLQVGVTRFELATTRPPDAYSNRAELHPESGLIKTNQYRF